jgi:Ca-activated chloride channel family protein
VTISWNGPNNGGDWLTIVKPDAAPAVYNDYVDADRDDRSLELPTEPGDYELRYVQAGTKVIARAPIVITAASATIEAPTSVAPNGSFEVAWTGPNNRGDWLTIIAPAAAAAAFGSYADADRGSPKTLQAPAAPGDYELRYVLKGRKIIARRPITVR